MIVLFDGDCGFCEACVRWIIDRDPAGVCRFAPLRSDAARAQLAPWNHVPEEYATLVAITENGILTASDAAVGVAGVLKFPWSLLGWLRWIPRPVRDGVYYWIAFHRHRLGCSNEKRLPRRNDLRRFLE